MCGRSPDIIPLDKCRDRYLYIINARNASIGIFHELTLSFVISRYKGNNYLFSEDHWDHPDGSGTAVPLKELEHVIYVGEEEDLAYLNKRYDELCKEGLIE